MADQNPPNQNPPDMNPPDIKALADSVVALRDSVQVITENHEKMLELFSEYVKLTDDAQKKVEDFGDSYKDIVTYTDDVKDNLREMVTSNKKFYNSFNNKTLKEAEAYFTRQLTHANKLLASGKANAKQTVALKRLIRENEEALAICAKNAGSMHKKLKDVSGTAAELSKHMQSGAHFAEQFANAVEGIKLGPLTKGMQSMNQLFGRGGGRLNNVIRFAQNAHDIKEAREAKKKENTSLFEEKKAQLRRTNPEYFDKMGNFNTAYFKENKGAVAHATEAMAGPGAGGLERALMGRLLTKGKGAGMLASGGGSMVEGLLGGMEGGMAGGLSKLAGRFALPIAIGGAVKDVLDKVAKQNQEVEKNLGKGGIFTGKEGGSEALANVKENLRAWGFNRMGITTERQMAVAQTMQEEGIGVSQLAKKGAGLGVGMGGIADIAFKQAREVGLTDVEGTKETIKLLQQYHTTLEGSRKFFQTVARDTRAAGISTTKYLQLIDDVTGQFDTLGKSIDTVTTTLRVLGRTGINTFDSMKDSVSALIGSEKTVEQRAFLSTVMGQGDQAEMQKVNQALADDAQEKFKQGLADALNEIAPGEGGKGKREQVMNAFQKGGVDEALRQFGSVKGTEAGGAATQQLADLARLAQAAQIRAGKGGAVSGAFMEELVPQDVSNRMVKQMAAMQFAFKKAGTSLEDFVENANVLNKEGVAPIVSQVGQAVGLDNQNKILQMRSVIQQTAGSTVDELLGGLKLNPEERKGHEDEIEGLYQKLGKAADIQQEAGKSWEETITGKMQKGEITPEMISAMKKSTEIGFAKSPAELVKSLSETNVVNKSLLNQNKETTKEQADKIAEISTDTRDSLSYLKGIEDALTNVVGQRIQNVFTWLAKRFGNDNTRVQEKMMNPYFASDVDMLQKVVEQVGDFKDFTATRGATTGMNGKQLLDKYNELSRKNQMGQLTDEETKELNDVIDTIQATVAHTKSGEDFANAQVVEELRKAGFEYDKKRGQYVAIPENPAAGAKAADVKSEEGQGGPKVVNNNDNRKTITNNASAPVVNPPATDAPKHAQEQATPDVKASPSITSPFSPKVSSGSIQ